jgi:hypothetical protein
MEAAEVPAARSRLSIPGHHSPLVQMQRALHVLQHLLLLG